MSRLDGPRQRFFDLWSHVYDAPAVQRAIYRPVHEGVLTALRATAPRSVVDVGCGTGILTTRARDVLPGALLVGADFSFGMLEQATRRDGGRRPAWVQSDAQHLPLRGASVDAVVSTEAFHWFPDPDAALAEFHRVLRPGGCLILALVNVRTQSASRLADAGSRLAGEPLHWPTGRELRHQLERGGFEIRRQQRIVRITGLLLPAVLTVASPL